MRGHDFAIRLLAGCVLLLTMLSAAAPTSAQDGGSTVTVHKRLCPTGYGGSDYYATCHGNPQEGVSFTLDGQRTTTGENGNAAFSALAAGTYTIIEETLSGDAVESRISCSVGGVASREAEYSEVSGGIELTVPQRASIICDWYNIPRDLRGDGDADGATSCRSSSCAAR